MHHPPTPRQRHTYGQRPDKPGLYLGLFHGRRERRAQMEDWGFNGPLLGPLAYCHTTYLANIKIAFEESEDARLCCGSAHDDVMLDVVDDMIAFEGAYYGDWTLFVVEPEACERPADTFRRTQRRNQLQAHASYQEG